MDDWKVIHRDGTRVTQGSFNALMARMDELERKVVELRQPAGPHMVILVCDSRVQIRSDLTFACANNFVESVIKNGFSGVAIVGKAVRTLHNIKYHYILKAMGEGVSVTSVEVDELHKPALQLNAECREIEDPKEL